MDCLHVRASLFVILPAIGKFGLYQLAKKYADNRQELITKLQHFKERNEILNNEQNNILL